MQNKNIALACVLLAVVGSIWYIQSKKARPSSVDTPAVLVTLPDLDNTPSTTPPVIPDTTAVTPASPVNKRAGYLTVAQKAQKYLPAREITTPDGFVNTGGKPIKIADYIGKKVILIDFWTYSCINCQRTLPYLEGWYTKYEDAGLVIIGIHTPEFEFEKDYQNVKDAVARLGITFPVVLDNDYSTWNAYANHYWPHKYLIDIDGYVSYDHIGEGGYAESEQKIQEALKERAQVLGTGQTIPGGIINPAGATTIETQSPETYFGAARNEFLANGTVGGKGTINFTLPASFDLNSLYLDGSWNMLDEYAESSSDTSQIAYRYNAKNIYFVAAADTPVTVEIIQDGKSTGTITIKDAKLYTLVQNGAEGTHTLLLKVKGKGLKAFTITFG